MPQTARIRISFAVPEHGDEGGAGDGVDEFALGREVFRDGVGAVHDLRHGDVQAAVSQHVDVVGEDLRGRWGILDCNPTFKNGVHICPQTNGPARHRRKVLRPYLNTSYAFGN